MIILPLAWDSDFFGLRIARIDIAEKSEEESLWSLLQGENQFDLVYVFTPEDVPLSIPSEVENCYLVDQKIVFSKPISKATSIDLKLPFQIVEYGSLSIEPELEAIAYQSGEYSRFKLDRRFNPNDFFRLYKRWLENSVTHTIADFVFVARVNGVVVGLVTAKISGTNASIGLLAVDEQARGLRIGTNLMSHLEMEMEKRGVNTLFVPTQLGNVRSCQFYIKNGFTKSSLTNIYHYWR